MRSFRELADLSGRVAIVTGGGGNLGLVFCEALAELRATVIVVDVVADRAEARANDLKARFGAVASACAADITSESDAARVVARVVEQHGRIDILVNNAAYARMPLPPDGFALRDQNLAQWDAQLSVILRGTFLMTRSCVDALTASSAGTIVNIASIYGLLGPVPSLYSGTALVNEAHYAAGKGGVVQLTRYFATLLAPRVRANCIAPGGIEAGQPAEFQQRYRERTPLARMARGEDLKGALAFFASDLSAFVTGQVLPVDGGWTAW